MSMADSLPGSENRLLALIEFRRRFDEIRQVHRGHSSVKALTLI